MADRYNTIKTKRDLRKGHKYFVNVVYPDIPPTAEDVYITSRIGDRTDLLAYDYYGDESLWWVINIANPDIIKRWSYFLDVGLQVRIPANIDPILENFEEINRAR
jgi:phage tail protein X